MRNAVLFAAVVILSSALSHGQKYKVLWSFGGAAMADGSRPVSKLVSDAAGNLYGTTEAGGSTVATICPSGCGTIFKLSPSENGTWSETVIYTFCTSPSNGLCLDGAFPVSAVTFDSSGNLYGTTSGGGPPCPIGFPSCGTVFELSPPMHPEASWTETVLYSFCENGVDRLASEECADGFSPRGRLTFDTAGNLYGTTWGGGTSAGGTVFELSPKFGTWTETVLYNFCSLGQAPSPCPDGVAPQAGVVFDKFGNMYGTTQAGGSKQFAGGGVVYRLTSGQQSWKESVLYAFTAMNGPRGANLNAEVNFDSAGHLFSTCTGGGLNGVGGVYRLSSRSPKEITFSFTSDNGAQPLAGVLIDPRNNNLYGTTEYCGAGGVGVVFKIAGTTETVLHSFTGGADGQQPVAALTADGKGNLYGTTEYGGTNDLGTVFEITP